MKWEETTVADAVHGPKRLT